MRALFVTLMILAAVGVLSAYEIISSVKLKANSSEFSKLEGRRFEMR